MSSPSGPPFFRLDPTERQPREEVLARGRGGLQLQRNPQGWRKLTRAQLAAAVAVPALILLGIALGESGAPLPVVVISIALLILFLVAFAFSGRHHKGGSGDEPNAPRSLQGGQATGGRIETQ